MDVLGFGKSGTAVEEHYQSPEIQQQQKHALMEVGNHKLNEQTKWVLTDALSRNDPVGTVAGYYDEALSIAGVSGYFLEDLGFSYEEFLQATGGSFRKIVRDTPVFPFSMEKFRKERGKGRYCLITRKGTLISVGTFKEESTDDEGRPMWVLAVRVIMEEMEAEAERQRMRRENQAMDQLLQGVTRMVENFVVCDVCQDRYEFYDMDNRADYAPGGSYRDFLLRLDTGYVALINGENVTMSNLLSVDHLREVLRTEKDIYKFEFCSMDKRRFKVLSVIPVEWTEGELTRVLLISQDVGQKYELENLANTDSLTNLFNERYLVKTLERMEKRRQSFTLFYLDLDLFKPVNDSYGHSVGDQLLRAVAGRLKNCIRSADLAFRIGGDEFVLILVGDTNVNLCQTMVQRVRDAVGQPFDISGRCICVDVSCGYAIFPQEGNTAEEIRILADKRMYRDKEHHEERERVLQERYRSGQMDLR